ncbi:hypothetical protein PR048_025832 [Dryococelus australis]|uniref:Uncharacterized protein n=1 Tax=Dryococelus australis TaxID=614101 RepID=A0ABQ9GJP1_9NEOP|nr:hypothetical protein PR048_025832 [Dryococelus australis]
MAKSFGDDKLANIFETVSLLHQNVSRRTAKISKQLDAQLIKKLRKKNYLIVISYQCKRLRYLQCPCVSCREVWRIFQMFVHSDRRC